MICLSPCVRLVRALVLLVALVLPASAGRAAEPDPALAPPGHGWRELTFTATRFTAALSVRLRIEPVVADAEGANRPAAGFPDDVGDRSRGRRLNASGGRRSSGVHRAQPRGCDFCSSGSP